MRTAYWEFIMGKYCILPACSIMTLGAVRAHPALVLVILLVAAQTAFIEFSDMLCFVTVLA
jgi:hypothetical protein